MSARLRIPLACALFACLAACATTEAAPPDDLERVRIVTEDADPERRLAALRGIENTALLLWLATESEHEDIRRAALGRLDDDLALEALLREDPSLAPRILPRFDDSGRIARLLVELELELDRRTAGRALGRLDPEGELVDVAWRAPLELRLLAIGRLSDPAPLEALARGAASAEERTAAIARLEDSEVLESLALADPDATVGQAAVRRIEDEEVLGRLALEDNPTVLRLEALVRVKSRGTLEELAGQDGVVADLSRLRLSLREPLLEEAVRTTFTVLSGTEPDSEHTGASVRVRFYRRADEEVGSRPLVRADAEDNLDVPALLGRLLRVLESTPEERSTLSRSPTTELRLACLRGPVEPDDLQRLATTDPEVGVRLAAVRQVSDVDTLVRIACQDRAETVAVRALEALAVLEHESALGQVALEAQKAHVRRRATWRLTNLAPLTNPDVLARVALEDPRPEIRSTAVRGVRDARLLAGIARSDSEAGVRYNAAVSIEDPDELRLLEAEGGTVGGLAACKLRLLDTALLRAVGRLSLRVERGPDDILYRTGPEPRVVIGEWVHLIVIHDAGDGLPPAVVHVQEWAMPRAISEDEDAEWLDVVIDPDAFSARVLAALEG